MEKLNEDKFKRNSFHIKRSEFKEKFNSKF